MCNKCKGDSIRRNHQHVEGNKCKLKNSGGQMYEIKMLIDYVDARLTIIYELFRHQR
jgi:hypothetical protein